QIKAFSRNCSEVGEELLPSSHEQNPEVLPPGSCERERMKPPLPMAYSINHDLMSHSPGK
ncbi:unnamed protein product, partial [Gulo gulo]